MKNETISTSVPAEVAEAIRKMATAQDRTVSKVAGRILAYGLNKAPVPSAQFARRPKKGVQS